MLISQLRCGSLPLAIETGHYYGIPQTERLCPFCGSETEDELHFMYRCPTYAGEHNILYNKIPELRSLDTDLAKLKLLGNHLHTLGKHLVKLWNESDVLIRNDTII